MNYLDPHSGSYKNESIRRSQLFKLRGTIFDCFITEVLAPIRGFTLLSLVQAIT
ncbi:MAG: hypothetical protein AAF383_14105 [Cyanobacteria bacterium P01_A01_bin.83]